MMPDRHRPLLLLTGAARHSAASASDTSCQAGCGMRIRPNRQLVHRLRSHLLLGAPAQGSGCRIFPRHQTKPDHPPENHVAKTVPGRRAHPRVPSCTCQTLCWLDLPATALAPPPPSHNPEGLGQNPASTTHDDLPFLQTIQTSVGFTLRAIEMTQLGDSQKATQARSVN